MIIKETLGETYV